MLSLSFWRSFVPAVVTLGLMVTSCVNDNAPLPSSGGAVNSPSPTPREAPLEFVLDDRYGVGEKIAVRLRNNGVRPYIYNEVYEACDMRYFDESGRRFIIPPGTHCDILAEVEIEPGDTVTLFEWESNECVKDQWGCVKAKRLDPGTYRIVGRFTPEGGGKAVRVQETFELIARS